MTQTRHCFEASCHGARTVSGPNGLLSVVTDAGREAVAYRFELGITDSLICPDCGCYVAATMTESAASYGIVNIRMLADEAAFSAAETLRVYDAEDEEARLDVGCRSFLGFCRHA